MDRDDPLRFFEQLQRQLEEFVEQNDLDRRDGFFGRGIGVDRDQIDQIRDLREQMIEQAHGNSGTHVEDEGEELVAYFDLPEFEQDQVEVICEEESVTVEAEATDEMYHESTTVTVDLPEPVDHEEATASMENGFLEVRVPKQETNNHTTLQVE